ncbi:hypothetical protein ABZ468_51410 [Streptomyces sp. NPDC005708]|uniref:hypothetical protein n=1 Tax=Streptomyces sp. NPDC005708 TaxID=3154564 RepID=UPI0033CA96F2
MPADPAAKGGTEAPVRITKPDLVPTTVNLRPQYAGVPELQDACEDFTTEMNGRRPTRDPPDPAELLAEERPRLHSGSRSTLRSARPEASARLAALTSAVAATTGAAFDDAIAPTRRRKLPRLPLADVRGHGDGEDPTLLSRKPLAPAASAA